MHAWKVLFDQGTIFQRDTDRGDDNCGIGPAQTECAGACRVIGNHDSCCSGILRVLCLYYKRAGTPVDQGNSPGNVRSIHKRFATVAGCPDPVVCQCHVARKIGRSRRGAEGGSAELDYRPGKRRRGCNFQLL